MGCHDFDDNSGGSKCHFACSHVHLQAQADQSEREREARQRVQAFDSGLDARKQM